MDAKNAAEEFFGMLVKCKKNLSEIPQACSQGENGVLLYLSFKQDRVSPSELSDSLGVSLPRIASVLNSLENKKFIIKKIDTEDKRKSIVEITEIGKEYVSNKRNEAINDLAKVLDKLNEEERKEYLKLTSKIISTIENF